MSLTVRTLFTLFFISGFTGLVYQSVWSHYLKLFLGSAAFAQSLVLMMFMGGLAIGAWLVSRLVDRRVNLLAGYGWVEGVIGVFALVFHGVFVGLTDWSLESVIPALGSPVAVDVWKITLAALLIMPQTILLGMTFPMMSGAVIRRDPQASGHHLAMLYFTNSIGAAIGALVAAFWMIGAFGMAGSMRAAGLANVLLAVFVLWLARHGEPRPRSAEVPGEAAAGRGRDFYVRLFLGAAFVTGLASFIYEIAWVRMLSLVLGASFHAFELMLSAFIAGLALGGLWIRRRIDRIRDPVRFSGWVQILMGACALATIFVYHYAFDWMAWLVNVLRREEAAYPLFNLGSHLIAFAIMLPATFLAGMTLPLFTHVLMRKGHGERAIGQVYAANTLGAIAGVMIAVHVLLPQTGVKLTLVIGASLDMLLGAWLLRYTGRRSERFEAFATLIVCLGAASLTARGATLSPERLASGVFRYGQAELADHRVHYYQDGKTASVAMRAGPGGTVTLTTNGKPDASIMLAPGRPPTTDEYTMSIVAAIPLLMKPDAGRWANIGFGSGLTAEVLLSHSAPQRVDNIEIEPAVFRAARGFFPRVIRPYVDRRSHVHFEDAKTFFARNQSLYDVIISEPSNPWVAGTASLFTTEFYRDVRRHIAEGGLLVQWLQTYEIDDRLVASMLKALTENFEDYRIYEASHGDLMVVASPKGRVPPIGAWPAKEKAFLEHMDRLGVRSSAELSARLVATRQSMVPFLAVLDAPVNSDFRPFVQLNATRTRFLGKAATGIISLANSGLPVNEMLGGLPPPAIRAIVERPDSLRIGAINDALDLRRLLLDRTGAPYALGLRLALAVESVRSGALCRRTVDPGSLLQLHLLAEHTIAHLPPEMALELWREPRWLGCPAARLPVAVRERLALYSAVAKRDAGAMHALAEALLERTPAADPIRHYLLPAAMLGAKASGSVLAGERLYTRHVKELYPAGEYPPVLVYIANWIEGWK